MASRIALFGYAVILTLGLSVVPATSRSLTTEPPGWEGWIKGWLFDEQDENTPGTVPPTTEVPSSVFEYIEDPILDESDFPTESFKEPMDTSEEVSVEENALLVQSNNASDTGLASLLNDDQTALSQSLAELNVLADMLQANLDYVARRESEDPFWPESLAKKVSSNTATPEEQQLYLEDVQQCATGLAIMREMEEKVQSINNLIQQNLVSATPDQIKISLLGGEEEEIQKSTIVQFIDGILQMKYLEGYLNASNKLIGEQLRLGAEDSSVPITITIASPDEFSEGNSGGLPDPFLPVPGTFINDDDEDDEGTYTLAMILLGLATIGFLFLLWTFLYLAWHSVKKCSEACGSPQLKRKFNAKRGKYLYEQI